MMDTTIYKFHTSFYIPAIQKLAFHIKHIQILVTNNCGDSRRTAFKHREPFQYVLCRRDYSERVVASFTHHVKSEYYGGNRSVYIDGISLEHLCALPQTEIKSSTKSCPSHTMFHYFLSDGIRQDSDNTTENIKSLIEMLK